MDSYINLLPEKDKQLKRDAKPKAPSPLVEMTKPADRIFQERVVRIGGVLAFFKTLFKRKPKALPKPKVVTLEKPNETPIPAPRLAQSSSQVTKLETMHDRLAPGAKPPLPPPPPPPPPSSGLFSKLFGRSAVQKPVVKPGAPILVPAPRPVPPPAARPVMPPPAPQRASWSPPPPTAPVSPPARQPLPPAPHPAPAAGPVKPVPPPFVQTAPAKPASVPRPQAPSEPAPQSFVGGFGVNLVPDEFKPESSPRDRLKAISYVGAALFVVVAATVGLVVYARTLQHRVDNLQEQFDAAAAQAQGIEKVELGDALVIQKLSANLKYALDQHVYWDTFFQQLEAVTLPNVTYSTMSVDVGGNVTIAATARTINDVGTQLLAYQGATNFISSVTISSATLAQQQSSEAPPPGQQRASPQTLATFNVSMQVNPQIFYRR